VAAGTGLVAVEAAKILGTADNITCLDPSAACWLSPGPNWRRTLCWGGGTNALADNSYDFLTMGYALRHVTSLEATFREFNAS